MKEGRKVERKKGRKEGNGKEEKEEQRKNKQNLFLLFSYLVQYIVACTGSVLP